MADARISRNLFFRLNAYLVLAILPIVSSCTDIGLNPGIVRGNISYTQTSDCVNSFLVSNPVVASSSVRLIREDDYQMTYSTSYTPENTASDSTYLAATYDTRAETEADGRDFFLVVDSIKFSNGSEYRFGSSDACSPSVCRCEGVLPDVNTQCDINECAALINLQIRFVGSPNDFNALSTGIEHPVRYKVLAFIREAPTAISLSKQAETQNLSIPAEEMIGNSVSTPLLVRSDCPMKIRVEGDYEVQVGETGDTGRISFFEEIETAAATCGECRDLNIDIPIERGVVEETGKLTGLFDVSGHNEIRARIRIPNSSFSAGVPLLDEASDLPTEPWELEGIPVGEHAVVATAILDEGNSILEFPHRDGLNGKVNVMPNAVTDLGSTFISKPSKAIGCVILSDPGGGTDLKHFHNPPFYNYIPPPSGSSYITAYGAERTSPPGDSNCAGLSSSYGGKSTALLIGTYDSNENRAVLRYELLLNALSPEDGNTDGTSTCNAPWDIRSAHLYIQPEGSRAKELIDIYFAEDLHYTAGLNSDGEPEVFQPQEQSICFGGLNLKIIVRRPEHGSIYYPHIYSITDVNTIIPEPDTLYTLLSSVYGRAYGTPYSFEDRAQEATIALTLPHRFQYRLRPKIRLVPPNGDSSDTIDYTLDELIYPESGCLLCGSSGSVCCFVDEEGNLVCISISAPEEIEDCLPDGNIDIPVEIHSHGIDVIHAEYILDGDNNNPVVFCTSNCGVDPEYTISLHLEPGEHELYLYALTENGCDPNLTVRINVESAPLVLDCPNDFTVELVGDETFVSADDPRITDHNLVALLSGGCLPGPRRIDPEEMPEIFPIGRTPINFSHFGQTCRTFVTVEPAPVASEHFIAFIDSNSSSRFIKIHKIEDGSTTTLPFNAANLPIAYSPDGKRMGIVEDNNIKIVDCDTSIILHEISFLLQDRGKPKRIAFHPKDNSRYAVVTEHGLGQYKVRLFRNERMLGTTKLLPKGNRYAHIPELAWSRNGKYISAAWIVPRIDDDNQLNNSYTIITQEYQATHPLISPFYNRLNLNRENQETKPTPVERMHEILYADADDITERVLDVTERILVTNKGILLTVGDKFFTRVADIPNSDMDMSDDGQAVVFYNHAPDSSYKVEVLFLPPSPRSVTAEATIRAGIGKAEPQVAISSDEQYIAVSMGDGIHIYSIPDFSLVRIVEVEAENTLPFITFRPVVSQAP